MQQQIPIPQQMGINSAAFRQTIPQPCNPGTPFPSNQVKKKSRFSW